jgi:hypothetical protein
MEGISEEKRQWMKEVGMKEFDKPIKYYIGVNHLYSVEYIKNTPLEELKEKYDEELITLMFQ